MAARRVWNQASEVLKIIDEEATRRLQDPDLKQQLEVGMKVTAEVQKREHDKLRQQIALARSLKQPIEVGQDDDDPTYNQHKIAPHVAIYQPQWTVDELKEAQRTDPDLRLLYRHKEENLGRPTLAQVSGESAATKAYHRSSS